MDIHLFYFNTVAPEATLTVGSLNQTLSEGSSASLRCTSTGGPDNTYQWQFNGSNIIGETSQILMLSNVLASTGGIYGCLVTNEAGTDNPTTFVFISIYLVSQPMDVTSGSSASLVCGFEAFPYPDFQWERIDGQDIRDEVTSNTRTLAFDPMMLGDEGAYRCSASSLGVTVQSQSATITGIR